MAGLDKWKWDASNPEWKWDGLKVKTNELRITPNTDDFALLVSNFTTIVHSPHLGTIEVYGIVNGKTPIPGANMTVKEFLKALGLDKEDVG